MAKITSKSQINVGTELTINEAARTFTLNAAGNLVAKDGVTIQALYSKFIDLWATLTYQDSPFPMYAIDALSGQFQFGTDGQTFSGWVPANDATRQMLRDGGWTEFSAAGAMTRQYVGIVSLGAVSSGSQLYYQKASNGAPADFTFEDAVNEGIQVFGDAANGNFDTRTYFKGYVREEGKKYANSVLADTGKSATGAYIVNLLLSNEDDLKISAADSEMASAPYSDITVTYYASNQDIDIGGTDYPFRIIVDGNNATLEQIYTKLQYLLRQAGDIDSGAGTVIGKTANELCSFTGDVLYTTLGVFIENIQANDLNRIVFSDQNNVQRSYPYAAAGAMSFNSFLQGAGGYYRMFFTTLPGAGNDYGDAGAVTVNDADGNAIAGSVSAGSIGFSFDYDGNTQGGRTAGTDAAVTVIAGRPGSAKPVVASGVITRASGISISLVAEQDRAYA